MLMRESKCRFVEKHVAGGITSVKCDGEGVYKMLCCRLLQERTHAACGEIACVLWRVCMWRVGRIQSRTESTWPSAGCPDTMPKC